MEVRYAWGLGRKTISHAEVYGLFHGRSIAKNKGVKDIIILGDSHIYPIISPNLAIQRKIPYSLSQISDKIKSLASFFHSKDFFHILRSNNLEVDKETNKACTLGEAILDINGTLEFNLIP